ncbi:MAG: GspH/FimT family pseudopilin [Gammaproteobacteria bacterium]|nr:GspH/FimT family pseudopilin [Gammaproteobacteria bacterium]
MSFSGIHISLDRSTNLISNNRGFSLIEIMIVVLIIGISASMAILYIDNSDERLKTEAKRILAMVQLARDDAIMTGQSMALTIDTSQGIAQYYFSKLENGKWISFSNKPYSVISLSHDIKIRSILSKKASSTSVNDLENKELIHFLPTGETSEFQIWMNNENTEYILSSTILGELSLKKSEQL